MTAPISTAGKCSPACSRFKARWKDRKSTRLNSSHSIHDFLPISPACEYLMRRIRIQLAYDGTDFHGWQVQPGLLTIQGTLESVVGEIEGRPVHVAGSGRTDAGVHALAQVAAFSIENPIPPPNLRKAMNRLLPASIRVLSTAEAAPDFHPRFQALAKTYEYRIVRAEVCPAWAWLRTHHHPYP